MQATLNFARDPRSIARCRDFVAELLRSCPESTIERAVLLTSELVTNAIVHTSSSGVLALEHSLGSLKLMVTDDSEEAPTPLPHGMYDAHGHGLPIVNSLADDWGVDLVNSGKTVWATIESPDC